MTDITFTYTVTGKSADNNCLEVEYSAEGYPTILVGTPIPLQGTDLTEFFRSYAPIGQWATIGLQPIEIEVGLSGTVAPVVNVSATAAALGSSTATTTIDSSTVDALLAELRAGVTATTASVTASTSATTASTSSTTDTVVNPTVSTTST